MCSCRVKPSVVCGGTRCAPAGINPLLVAGAYIVGSCRDIHSVGCRGILKVCSCRDKPPVGWLG